MNLWNTIVRLVLDVSRAYRLAGMGSTERAALAVLGLTPSSLGTDPEATIRTAYRSRAREHHPDCGGQQGVMIRVNHAYEVLEIWLQRA